MGAGTDMTAALSMFGLSIDGSLRSPTGPKTRTNSVSVRVNAGEENKYLGAYLEQRRHFSPFMVSTGMISSANKRMKI